MKNVRSSLVLTLKAVIVARTIAAERKNVTSDTSHTKETRDVANIEIETIPQKSKYNTKIDIVSKTEPKVKKATGTRKRDRNN